MTAPAPKIDKPLPQQSFPFLVCTVSFVSAAAYVAVSETLYPGIPWTTHMTRVPAFLAALLLQALVAVGPVSRLHSALAAVRRSRHALTLVLGLVAALHAGAVLLIQHSGEKPYLWGAVVASYVDDYGRLLAAPGGLRQIPFEPFGALALVALLLAAAVAHSSWRVTLGPRVYRGVLALPYLAYILLIYHVGFGLLQAESHPGYIAAFLLGPLSLVALHGAAAMAARRPSMTSAIFPKATPESAQPSPPLVESFPRALAPHLWPFTTVTGRLFFAGGVIYMAVMAASQSGRDIGHRDTENRHEIEGVYYAEPVPTLYVTPEWLKSGPGGLHILLSLPDQSPLPASWAEADGQLVQMEGELLFRGYSAMLEVSSSQQLIVLGPPEAHQQRPPSGAGEPVQITGELVDIKCFLDTRMPATGKLHRSCAIRSLSGGAPPAILISGQHASAAVILAGPEDEALDYTPALAGQWVHVEGRLFRQHGYSYVRVETLERAE